MPLKQQKNAGNARKNAFNASILFQKSSECKKCFFNAGTIARSLVMTPEFRINRSQIQV